MVDVHCSQVFWARGIGDFTVLWGFVKKFTVYHRVSWVKRGLVHALKRDFMEKTKKKSFLTGGRGWGEEFPPQWENQTTHTFGWLSMYPNSPAQ